MITASEISCEDLYRNDDIVLKDFGLSEDAIFDIHEKLKPYRIFRINDYVNEPIPVYGDESWINSTETFPKKYSKEKSIYESEFIKVDLCRNIETDDMVAVKFIRLLKESKDSKIKTRHVRIEREISIVQKLRHNYIIGVKEVLKMVDCVAIVMEYARNGELFEYVQKRQRLPENEARTIMFQIFLAIDNLHSNGIVHRDLKLENILLASGNEIRIADFGFSNYWSDCQLDGSWKEMIMKTSCGSPCYAAPEIVLNNKGYNGFSVDIWSCGVIMFALLFGHLPFEDQALRHFKINNIVFRRTSRSSLNVYQLYQYISKNQLEIPKHVSVSSEAIDLLRGMLRSDPSKRITLSDIFRHSWFANCKLL